MSDKNTLGLSRRRVLGGLGAIGVASAGAGLGTSAYFSDTESFVGNILEAGSLDLFVHVDYAEYQQTGDAPTYETPPGTFIQGDTLGEDPDGEPLTIDVEDLKPGDSGEGELCFSIVDNPAYMWMCGELVANDENSVTEPEAESDEEDNEYDPDGDIDGMGELADAMMVSLTYCDSDGEPLEDEPFLQGTLAEVTTQLDNGVPLDGDLDVEGRQPFEGVSAPFDGEEPNVAEPCVCLEWWVPTEVGNEIQTDSVEFDVSFVAVQARHNDGDVNPCINGTVVEGFGKEAYDDATKLWFSKARNGGENTYELEVGNAPGSSDTADYDFGGSSFSGSFELSYDASAGEATFSLSDGSSGSVTYDVDDTAGDVLSVVARGNSSGHLAAVSDVRVNGTLPSGDTSVTADGNEINSLNVEDLDTGTDWTLTGDVELEGLDDSSGASDENPAVYVDVLDL